ncbi:MAG: 23S rRNA (uracil(1939)-C(5))-methyltransferase RlmD [Sulfobacillus acidophilus]|uniref:23S rRNA (Uracil(1939)-C(5))-methyltransferase RlmD n=1 Tax=Sulfobacillus acidophilus TaxID=53633 RepID=A0A2T2WGC0_9FIRM|nr:MAG: 23S rRNA (uracil(1939)-C(5))-methyltransferase RlmD [Sulfobacillus acidophilus]
MGEREVLAIDRMGQHGDGVGRGKDGRLVFVPGALPGETVIVEIREEHKNFMRGVVIDWLARASDRTHPICPAFGVCGGCVFQHWDYASEVRYKESRVRRALRLAGLDAGVVEAIRTCAHPYGYRNKGQFPFGGQVGQAVLGLYRHGTHEVVGVQHCDIQDDRVNQVLRRAEAIVNAIALPPYDEVHGTGIVRHLLIRSSRLQGQSLVLIVATRHDPRIMTLAQTLLNEVPGVHGVGLNLNPVAGNRVLGPTTRVLAGEGDIYERILGATFRLSMTSFFQVNPEQAAVLYEAALACLPEHVDQILDLYSGVGTLATLAASKATTVRAVETNPVAVADARVNFALNHIDNVEMNAARAEELLAQWAKQGKNPPWAIIVDPPRAGLDRHVTKTLQEVRPAQIIYISCNPETWARDLAQLAPVYSLQRAVPVDMFPRTDHVEVASCLLLNGN